MDPSHDIISEMWKNGIYNPMDIFQWCLSYIIHK
jgi:hypothetical protein